MKKLKEKRKHGRKTKNLKTKIWIIFRKKKITIEKQLVHIK